MILYYVNRACEMLDIYFIWRQLSFNEKIYFLLGIAIRFARTSKNHDSGVHYDWNLNICDTLRSKFELRADYR